MKDLKPPPPGPGVGARRADYVSDFNARREAWGRRVREVWVEWARTHPNPKPSWLVPYEDLDESDKEADRRIGAALWGDGFRDGVNTGLEMARQLTRNDGRGDGNEG